MDSSLVSTTLLAVSIVFPILATGAVGLRFLARKVKSQELMADDWMIVLSLVRLKLPPMPVASEREGQRERERETKYTQVMCWSISINTITTVAIGGLNTTMLDPIAAARLFIRVSLSCRNLTRVT